MKHAQTKAKQLAKRSADDLTESPSTFSAEERFAYISTAAYYKANARQFVPGREVDDWLEAAAEFDARV